METRQHLQIKRKTSSWLKYYTMKAILVGEHNLRSKQTKVLQAHLYRQLTSIQHQFQIRSSSWIRLISVLLKEVEIFNLRWQNRLMRNSQTWWKTLSKSLAKPNTLVHLTKRKVLMPLLLKAMDIQVLLCQTNFITPYTIWKTKSSLTDKMLLKSSLIIMYIF